MRNNGDSAKPDQFKAGDHVAWNTSQGETTGVVKKRLTERTSIHDHEVAASPEHPEHLVVSDKTGAEAAHRPDALRMLRKQLATARPAWEIGLAGLSIRTCAVEHS